jgi:transcription initiation factor IIE alpha subunit
VNQHGIKMVTLEHVKTLSPTELKILLYMSFTGRTQTITHEVLAKEINVNQRSIREALKILQERGLISCKRKKKESTESTITFH